MTQLKNSVCAIALAVLSFTSVANSVDKAQSIQSQTNAASANSQKRIDKSAEQTIKLHSEIEQLQQEVKNLQVYRDHLSALVESQDQEVDSLENQIQEINSTRQGVVPLMYQMLEGLASYADDMPIKSELRAERLHKLTNMMTRADIADAEKYRRILEAYQIELDYGIKLGLYQGEIEVDSNKLEVDMLHLGRISLIARSLNGVNYWSWNAVNHRWDALEPSMKTDLDKAFSIASKQSAPSLIRVPVSLTAEGK